MQEEISTKLIMADRLKELMDRNKITQVQLAEKIAVSQGSVSGWLKGRIPEPDKVEKISVFFGVSAEWLLCLDSETRIKNAVRFADMGGGQIGFDAKISEGLTDVFKHRYEKEKDRADVLSAENISLKKQLNQLKKQLSSIVDKL